MESWVASLELWPLWNKVSKRSESFLVIFEKILCGFCASAEVGVLFGECWEINKIVNQTASVFQRHIGWVPRFQNNVFKAISLSLRTRIFFWGVFVYNVIYSHVPWILMKGVVNLRDLQSLGKSQQHCFVCGQFHFLDFLMGSELDLANQDEQNRIRMSLGFSARLGFVFCLFLLKSAGVELGLL